MSDFTHSSDRFGMINLMTMTGVQTALAALGFHPGTIDGLDGPRTQAAVRAFQEQNFIKVDGVVGSETRGMLLAGLDNLAKEPVNAS